MKKSGIIVFKFSGVLFDEDYYLYRFILAHQNLYSDLVPAGKLMNEEAFRKRKNRSFLVDIIPADRIGSDEGRRLAKLLLDLTEIRRSQNIYESNEPTQLARGSLGNPLYMNSKDVRKIYVLVEGDKTQRDRQTAYIRNSFYDLENKIAILEKKPKETDYDLLKRRGVDWTLYATDDYAELKNMAEKTALAGKELMFPNLGYQTVEPKVAMLIDAKEGTLTLYDPA